MAGTFQRTERKLIAKVVRVPHGSDCPRPTRYTQRMIRGEFKTVAEAARTAGIYKSRPKSVGLPDVAGVDARTGDGCAAPGKLKRGPGP